MIAIEKKMELMVMTERVGFATSAIFLTLQYHFRNCFKLTTDKDIDSPPPTHEDLDVAE